MSSIEWTDRTWNPTRGCSRVSEGCRNCYAERLATRFSGPGQPYAGLVTVPDDGRHGQTGRARLNTRGKWNGVVRLVPEKLAEPLRWRKPQRVFVNSMSDLFHEALTNEEIAAVFGVMAACPHVTFQVLTKRAQRMHQWFEWAHASRTTATAAWCFQQYAIPALSALSAMQLSRAAKQPMPSWPLPNVWLGVSVEDQATADARIPWLLRTPSARRFVSYEPALNQASFVLWLMPGCVDCLGTGVGEGAPCEECGGSGRRPHLDWIIVGGESGPHARAFDIQWARQVVQECRESGTAVFVKQLGSVWAGAEWAKPGEGSHGWNRKGGDMAEWPEDLRVREFPR